MSMKHRKLGRTSDQRRAMLRAMVTYLLENGQIKTTVTRAKEVAPVAEKMITLAKKNDLPAYRQALGYITKELHHQGGCGQEAVPGDRPQVRRPQRRLHPRGEDWSPPRRRRRDGHCSAGLIRPLTQERRKSRPKRGGIR